MSGSAVHGPDADPAPGKPVIGVLLAGGTGSRFRASLPKQLAKLAGQPVLRFAVERFDLSPTVDALVVVVNPEWANAITEIVRSSIHTTPFQLVAGGPDRNTSVRNAIDAIEHDDAKILVHDTVRPLVTGELIEQVAATLDVSRSVIPVIPSADPILRTSGGLAGEFADRAEMVRGQSPQGFWLRDLRQGFAHDAGRGGDPWPTLFEMMRAWAPGFEIATIPGDFNNIKVTMPVDRLVAGQLLLAQEDAPGEGAPQPNQVSMPA